jgi:2-amino-4-hydroxy-6-hydroxymethyldihydropteridine diphosphokinase
MLASVDHVRRVVVGLGSNLNDRTAAMARAFEELGKSEGLYLLKRSPIYETPPSGGPPQGDFLNAAALIVSALPARALMDRLLAIEQALGRVRGERNGPRVIDLDLLWIEGEVIEEPALVVPHPRLTERAFALRPLLDVAPDAGHPTTGVRFAEMSEASAALRVFSGS